MKPVRFYLLLSAALVMSAHQLSAQNYESDSVYYTRIPKTFKERQLSGQTIYSDTSRSIPYLKYFSNFTVGTQIGCSKCLSEREISFNASTIHGVTVGKKFRIGAGVGFDTYGDWQTMPLFGNLSWDVFGTRNTHAIFVQGQLGWSVAWYDRRVLGENNFLVDVRGGKMMSAQVGYRVKLSDFQIAFLAGVKNQEVASYFEFETFGPDSNGTWGPGVKSKRTLYRNMDRFMMTVAFGWK